MKVKLAVQTFSKSVADAIDFCRDILKIDEFKNSEATSNFIRRINDGFDILNSQKKSDIGLKKPISNQNFIEIMNICYQNIEYLQKLKLKSGKLVVQCQRKTGFTYILNDNLFKESQSNL